MKKKIQLFAIVLLIILIGAADSCGDDPKYQETKNKTISHGK